MPVSFAPLGFQLPSLAALVQCLHPHDLDLLRNDIVNNCVPSMLHHSAKLMRDDCCRLYWEAKLEGQYTFSALWLPVLALDSTFHAIPAGGRRRAGTLQLMKICQQVLYDLVVHVTDLSIPFASSTPSTRVYAVESCVTYSASIENPTATFTTTKKYTGIREILVVKESDFLSLV
jgi:hypothetical protein